MKTQEMRALILITCLGCFVSPGTAQDRMGLGPILTFEAPSKGNIPGGWTGFPTDTIFNDGAIVHGGRHSVRIERNDQSGGAFSGISCTIPVDFEGSSVELRGFIRTELLSEFAGLWIREVGEAPSLAYENMENRHVGGTTDWTEYSIVVPLVPGAKQLVFGFLAAGTGRAWADDLRLFVDGEPVWDAPRLEKQATVLDRDHEFDGGSKIDDRDLSDLQIENLKLLGKVWGFLKYHHPAVRAGKRHWDYDLFRILPAVLAAGNQAEALAAITKWEGELGPLPKCVKCAVLSEEGLALRPDLKWIASEQLGDLGKALRAVYAARPVDGKQFYVSQAQQSGRLHFDHELAYVDADAGKAPDLGFRLLALFRFWNAQQYWSPYRELVKEDWDQALAAAIARMARVSSATAYEMEVNTLLGLEHDAQVKLKSPAPLDGCPTPVPVRSVGVASVVRGFGSSAPGLEPGEVFEEIPGSARGNCGETLVRVRQGAGTSEIQAAKVEAPHDMPGDTFRRMASGLIEIAYLKASGMRVTDSTQYLERILGTAGLIIDLRSSSVEQVGPELVALLVSKDTDVARRTVADPANPGAFRWRGKPETITPSMRNYNWRVAILVDELTRGEAEFAALALKAVPGAKLVGSVTAGSPGILNSIRLPGGTTAPMTTVGTWLPDRTVVQGVGIQPDVLVKPTVAGLQAGRDEVLEAAIRAVLGNRVNDQQLRQFTKP